MRFHSISKTLGLGAAGVAMAANLATAQCPAADAFEPNDDCLTAPVLANGTYNTLTVHGSGSAVNDDYYSISVPAGEILTVDCLFIDAIADVDIYLYDPATSPNCGGEAAADYLVRGYTATDNETVEYSNLTASAITLIVRVEIFTTGAVCNDYSLVVNTAPDPCVAAIDDGLEQNDSCGAAVALASGLHTGLFTSVGDEDYYLVTVPAGEILTVDTTYSGSTDVDLELFSDLACTTQVDFSFSLGGTGQVTWPNTSAAPAVVVMRVAPDAATGSCNNYDLNIFSVPDPCSGPDDSFEDNDDCASAPTMVDGTYTNLFARDFDEDYYEVTLADLDTLTVDILFSDALGDMDLEFYESQADCALDVPLIGSYGVVDNETVSYTNTTGSTLTIVVHVYHWTGDTASDCNTYDMIIDGSGGSFATPMCFGDGSGGSCPCANESTLGAGEGCKSSLGVGAILTASGSASVAADDIAFSVTQARPNQTSMLLQGATLISVPFKDGNFCMGNPTERIEVVFLDATGSGSTTTSVVTEGNVVPGNTRYYQHWFRDPGGVSPCGNGSNFSNGLTVVYLP